MLGPIRTSTMTLVTLSSYRLKKTHVPELRDVPPAPNTTVGRATTTTKVARRVGLMDKGSPRATISSNCHPEKIRKVVLADCCQS